MNKKTLNKLVRVSKIIDKYSIEPDDGTFDDAAYTKKTAAELKAESDTQEAKTILKNMPEGLFQNLDVLEEALEQFVKDMNVLSELGEAARNESR